jgi:hypothetical protein
MMYRDDGRSSRAAMIFVLPAGAALAWVACEGDVIVDRSSTTHVTSGPGGATGTGTMNTGTAGAGTDGSTGAGGVAADAGDGGCNPVAPPQDTALRGCFRSTLCPPAHTASARDQLAAAIPTCDTNRFPCCREPVIDEVVCGPSAPDGDCCYTALVKVLQCPVSEPPPGADAGTCTPDGEFCERPEDCCSDQCNDESMCGPILCRPEGYFCQRSSDCCELSCQASPFGPHCYLCVPLNGLCGDGGVPCCAGSCDARGRCEL